MRELATTSASKSTRVGEMSARSDSGRAARGASPRVAATRSSASGRGAAPGHHLEWRGRLWRPGHLGDLPAPPVSVVEEAHRDQMGDLPHRLLRGDSLDVARRLFDDGTRASLVYLDPPFASQTSYVHEARLDGPADGRVRRVRAYDDSWPQGTYLDMLAPRLEALSRLLTPEGSLWVHVDWRASYLVRALLDEILGPDRFLNEIVWKRAPNLGRQAASGQFGRTLDTIVVYGGPRARLTPPTRLEPIEPATIRRDDEGRPFTLAPRGDYTDASVAKLEKVGRIHRTPTGKVYVKYFLVPDGEGRLCRERRVDALWTDVAPLRHVAVSERTGYPTQKPRALLERIVACATRPGDTVVDLFSGSGTTGEASHVLGRRAILGDLGNVGIATARARLLRAGAGLTIETLQKSTAVHASAKIACRKRGGALEIDLVAPEEPLAWAIGTRASKQSPFVALWHSERAPGTRPSPPARSATIAMPTQGTLFARVYEDDGSIHECAVLPPTRGGS